MDLNYINMMATGLTIEVERVIHPSVSSVAILRSSCAFTETYQGASN